MKSLYNLKQAGQLWNKTITKFFRKISFTSTNVDTYILTIQWKGELIIVGVYIDDLVLSSRSLKVLEWLKNKLIREFNMKDLGKAKKTIGWEITREKSILKIDKKGYIRDHLESERMTSCHTTILPVKAGSILVLD